MSQENKDDAAAAVSVPAIDPNTTEAVLARAGDILPIGEYNMLRTYIEAGKYPLAPETCTRFFELFLNGTTCSEIHRLNKSFPYEAILWARVKYNWDIEKDLYIATLQTQVREKVMKAQLETTSLVTDILSATNKRYGDKLKRYIQSGDEKDLQGVISVDNINGLLKLTEGLLKITGQDRVTKNVTENKNTTEINVNARGAGDESLSAEAAAKILAIVADEKRNNEKKKQP